jgi:exodeoxyribonuclease V beta subunit
VSAPPTFDVCGPLPTGVTLLEASAGTGKTFTIAALAARYVAEGTPLEHVLLITFGRMATGELRSRVRERLVTAERGLRGCLAGAPPPPDDEVLALLTSVGDDELAVRHHRLAAALADFDAATIATTHGFCQHALASLGVAGDIEGDATFVEDPTDLVEEVIADLYVRKFRRYDAPFDLAEALRIGKAAVFNPSATLVPVDVDRDSEPAMRRRLAVAVRKEVGRRKLRLKLLTYDDLLTRLADALGDRSRGDAAKARLGERYRVALVDEFQDTDPIQWEIVRTAFGEGDTTLVLIGDPKQAIYNFRGADVYAYLAAARTATTLATLGINWRSDQALIDAYDALMGGARLGHPGIEYRTVRAADAHQERRLRGAPQTASLRVRVLHRDDGLVRPTNQGWAAVDPARQVIAADLADDVVELLSSGAEIVTPAGGVEVVRPGHVAVLVSRNRDAATVRDALDAVGVPAVINGAGSVFGTPIARDWRALLEALERPSSSGRVHAVALTVFVGWSPERVATADEAAWEEVYDDVHRWAELLRRRGVAALLESISHAERLPGRVLARLDGERTLTDLRHIGQLLHAEAVAGELGVTALAAWLRRRIAEAAQDVANEDRSRRLESDSEAVQVLTIHRSKGLEFPIVYCPFLWNEGWIDAKDPPVFHDPAADDRRTVDVGGVAGPAFEAHRQRYVVEERGEELRLAYVALTRARHQAVVWWASSYGSRESPLARLLFASDGSSLATAPSEQQVVERVRAIADAAPGTISVERCTGGTGAVWAATEITGGELAVRTFDRTLDSGWRRTSYTALTSDLHDADVASEPEDAGITDEQVPTGPAPAVVPAADTEWLRSVSLPLAAMAGGARVGSLVHAVLEHVDFTAPDLTDVVATGLAEQLAWSRIDVGPVESVVDGLVAAIETPLGPIVGDARLRDVGRADRLDELGFELPLVGGDTPAAVLTLAALADVLDAHVEAGDPLAGYATRLRDPRLRQQLRGYLNGSLDLVVRRVDADGTARFAVVDYKSNWLGVEGEELTAWHYRPESVVAAMHHAHYPLQALFYVVALHRYLRWRLPGYHPDRNLAGVLYLFLRGMTGADVPRIDGQPCGVFSWSPPAGLVDAVSDLLDRGAVAA